MTLSTSPYSSSFSPGMQCDQIGRFLKVYGNKFACKSSPKSLLTYGVFEKDQLL